MANPIEFDIRPINGRVPAPHSAKRGQYQKIVTDVLRTNEGKELHCKSESNQLAAYQGIKRAIKRLADPNMVKTSMHTDSTNSTFIVYVEPA